MILVRFNLVSHTTQKQIARWLLFGQKGGHTTTVNNCWLVAGGWFDVREKYC
jgi:hypothetical protein